MTETPHGSSASDAGRDEDVPVLPDQPDALGDPSVDEVAGAESGDAESTQYEMRSMQDPVEPAADDPGSQLNF